MLPATVLKTSFCVVIVYCLLLNAYYVSTLNANCVTASGSDWYWHAWMEWWSADVRCSASRQRAAEHSVVDRVWWRHWPGVDRVTQLCAWWQPTADYAVWRTYPVWSERQLCLWNTRSQLCFAGHHLSYGNDLPQVFTAALAFTV